MKSRAPHTSRILRGALILAHLVLSGLMAHHAHAQELGLPSPYFIDEVHCEGLFVPKIEASWLLPDEEVASAKREFELQTCDTVMKIYGLEKFNWLSPEDFERTAAQIKNSGDFAEAELSLKKSELKNHVHVYLKVKPTDPYKFSLQNDYRYYAGKAGASARHGNRLQFNVTDTRNAPILKQNYGVVIDGTHADSAMASPIIGLQQSDLDRMSRKTSYNVDMYLKQEAWLSRSVGYNLNLHLLTDNNYSDGDARMTFALDGDVRFRTRESIFKGRSYFGLGFLSATIFPYQITKDPPTRSTTVFMPGLIAGYNYGTEYGGYLNFHVGAHQHSPSIYLTEINLSAQYRLSYWDTAIVGEMKTRNSIGVSLPQDRYPFASTGKSNSYIGLAKFIHTGGAKHKISAVTGYESLSAEEYRNLANTVVPSSTASYVGLKYQASLKNWDLQIGANYFYDRNH